MSLALYRKYRPQAFDELVGQHHIKITIQNEIASDKVPHAFLFSGPRGLGKTTIARLISKSVNCLKRKKNEYEPCNDCDSCKDIMDGRCMDVIEIDAASHTGVDNVRENIIANSRFTPTNRKFKVFIIDEVHMLSTSAFNALLKTLEEPPAHAMFVLATTEIHKIPETIISRCQRFDFRKVNLEDLITRLTFIIGKEKKKVDKEVLNSIARFATGGVRDAESLLGQVLSLGDKEITQKQAELVIPVSRIDLVIEFINYLLKNNTADGLLLVNKLLQDGVDLQKFTVDTIEVLRKLLLLKVGNQLDEFALQVSPDDQKELEKLMKIAEIKKLGKMIEIFIRAQQQLKSAEILQLPLELAVVEITKDANDDSDERDNSSGDKIIRKAVVIKPTVKKEEIKTEVKKVIAKDEGETSPSRTKLESASPEPRSVKDFSITLEQLQSKWDEVVVELKNHNHSLASTLRHHGPTAVNAEGVVEISFKYKFYLQRINDAKNVALIEATLANIFDLPLRIETILVKSLSQPKAEQTTLGSEVVDQKPLNDLVENFGGTIID